MTTYKPGDLLLVKNYKHSKISDLIMAGERADYGNTEYAEWTHIAIIVSPEGELIEWLSEGCRRTNISKYANYETHVIDTGAISWQRNHAIKVANHFLVTHSKYDYTDFVGLAGQALFGIDLSFHEDAHFICSAGAARCCISYVITWPKDITAMKPSDFAYYYNVHAGLAPEPLGWFARLLDGLRTVARTVSPF